MLTNGTVTRLPRRSRTEPSSVSSAVLPLPVPADDAQERAPASRPAGLDAGVFQDLPDEILASRAAARDPHAWEQIINRHGAYLTSIGRRFRLSPEEVADAVQDTWLNAVTHLADLRDRGSLRPWLGAIMWRGCIKMIKNRRQDQERLVGDFTDTVGGSLSDQRVNVEHEVLAAERSTVLRQALGLLPDRDRELLRECLVEGRSYDEITQRLAMPVGSIGPTRQRALRRLRGILEQTPGSDLLRAA